MDLYAYTEGGSRREMREDSTPLMVLLGAVDDESRNPSYQAGWEMVQGELL
jgi:hypothetical protein